MSEIEFIFEDVIIQTQQVFYTSVLYISDLFTAQSTYNNITLIFNLLFLIVVFVQILLLYYQLTEKRKNNTPKISQNITNELIMSTYE